MPTDHTDTAADRPTRPPAPLKVKPSSSVMPSAFTLTSFFAVTAAPARISALVSLRMPPTSTAPPTPTKPPAIAPAKDVMRTSFAAFTQTLWLPLAPELSPWLISALPIHAKVSESTSVTVTAPETPTKPAPPAAVRWKMSSLDCACTTSPCTVPVPKSSPPPVMLPFSTPPTPVPAPPAYTSAPSAM